MGLHNCIRVCKKTKAITVHFEVLICHVAKKGEEEKKNVCIKNTHGYIPRKRNAISKKIVLHFFKHFVLNIFSEKR